MNQRRQGRDEGGRKGGSVKRRQPRSLVPSLPPSNSRRRGFLLADCEIARACAAKVPMPVPCVRCDDDDPLITRRNSYIHNRENIVRRSIKDIRGG